MSDPTETARRVLDLDKQATQGPWRWDPKRGTYEYNAQNVGGFVAGGAAVCHFGNSEQYYPEQGEPPNEADRALIAEYRTAAPELARALLESQAALAAANARAADATKRAIEQERLRIEEAQAQTVQMREVVRQDHCDYGDACVLHKMKEVVSTLPAPAARTYDDAIRDAAKAIRDQAIRTFGKPTTVANGYAEVVESLLAKHAAPAPPPADAKETPAAMPGLVFGEPDAEGDREAKAVDGGHYEVCTSEERPGQWFWTGPKMIGLAYVATEAEAIAAASAHNAARLAKKGGE